MSQQRLIFVNRFFYPNESATSQILTDVCCALADDAWDVRVIASDGGEPGKPRLARTAAVKSVSVRRVRSARFGGHSLLGRTVEYLSFYPGALAQLIRSARRDDVIVVKTDPPMFVILAWLAAKMKRAKLIFWLQDLYPEVAIELGVSGLRGPLGSALIGLRNAALRGAAANIVIGQLMKDRLVAAGVRPARVHVLPNWSDDAIKPLPVTESTTRKEWAIKDGMFVFGYSGNLGRAHESATLLGAATLLQHRRDICFLFIGGGHESQQLKKVVTDAGLENFLFQPHQPRDQLSHSMAASDAHWLSLRPELEGLIVPSKFYGILSAGRPVVAVVAEDGEIARTIDDLDCGYVVKPGDAARLAAVITELADNPMYARQLGQRARTGSDEKFARPLALKRWTSIIRQVTRVPAFE